MYGPMYECPACHELFWNETEVIAHIQKNHPGKD